MALQQYWEVDRSDMKEMWRRVIGPEQEDPIETAKHCETIFESIPSGDSCLEIGAGVGRLLRWATHHFSYATGVDYSSSLVEISKEYLKNFPATIVHGDGKTLPFPDNAFDFVYSYTCFHHIPELENIQSYIQETFRVLKPGKLCRIQTVQGDYTQGYDGRVFLSVDDFWNEFDRVGFEKVKTELIEARIWITAKKP
jgi:ubiquinone/menaquinone biosynthesis C-methylase UbiE